MPTVPMTSRPIARRPIARRPIASRPMSSEPIARRPIASRPGSTVLVVEDDSDNRQLLVEILQHAGLATEVAADGTAGLARARSLRPDLVLLDVRMPGLSGIEVCEHLRAGSDTADLPILLLTACADAPEIEVGMRAGADDYVVKPFSPRELVCRVEAVLSRTAHRPVGLPAGLLATVAIRAIRLPRRPAGPQAGWDTGRWNRPGDAALAG